MPDARGGAAPQAAAEIPAYGRVDEAERIGFDTCTSGPA
jgi:hypothetical protein